MMMMIKTHQIRRQGQHPHKQSLVSPCTRQGSRGGETGARNRRKVAKARAGNRVKGRGCKKKFRLGRIVLGLLPSTRERSRHWRSWKSEGLRKPKELLEEESLATLKAAIKTVIRYQNRKRKGGRNGKVKQGQAEIGAWLETQPGGNRS